MFALGILVLLASIAVGCLVGGFIRGARELGK